MEGIARDDGTSSSTPNIPIKMTGRNEHEFVSTLRERMDRHSSLRKYPRIFPASGEFVYILVQDKRNGDKRSAQSAKR